MKSISKIFSLSFLFFSHYFIFAQCCSSGCSMSGSKNFGVLEKKHLQTIVFYKHNYSDTYYKGNIPYDFHYLINSSFNYSGLNLSYGFTSKFTIETDMGYYLNKTQNYYFNNYQLVGHGLSDISLLLKYNFFNSKDSVMGFTVTGGSKFPIGSYREYTKDKVKLPRDVQSGTGAYSVIAGLNVKIKTSKKLTFIINTKAEWNTINPEGYQYGISNTNSISSSFKIYKKISFFIMAKNENRKMDFDIYKNDYISSSGFNKITAMPGITAELNREWELGLYTDMPFYQKYNGTQFGNKYAISISISKQFELHKKSSH